MLPTRCRGTATHTSRTTRYIGDPFQGAGLSPPCFSSTVRCGGRFRPRRLLAWPFHDRADGIGEGGFLSRGVRFLTR
jgi:hypothetical protein